MVPCEDWEQLVVENLALAAWCAKAAYKGWVARRITWDDAVAAATLGLVEAARRFDPARGNRFTTFAVWYCRSRVQDAAAAGGVVTVPRTDRGARRREETAARAARAAGRHRPLSADWEESMPHADDAAIRDAESAAHAAGRAGALLRRLDARSRDVVLSRARGEALADVGRRLGVTRERVRQIQAKAMRRLRALASQGVVADEEV